MIKILKILCYEKSRKAFIWHGQRESRLLSVSKIVKLYVTMKIEELAIMTKNVVTQTNVPKLLTLSASLGKNNKQNMFKFILYMYLVFILLNS